MINKSVPTPAELQQDYLAAKALGSALLASNGMLVPDGNEDLRLLIQGFTRPIITQNDPAEVNYAGGLGAHVNTVPKTAYQMSVTLLETEAGRIEDFAEYLINNDGQMDCWAYDGRPERYTRRFRLHDCIFTFDGAGDIQADSRSQVVTVQATMNYVYFGQNESLGGGSSSQPGKVNIINAAQTSLGRLQRKLQALKSLTGR